jgi:hypothetical protein
MSWKRALPLLGGQVVFASVVAGLPGTASPAYPGPNGSKIAFRSVRDDPFGGVYTMNTDGSGVTRLDVGITIERPHARSGPVAKEEEK